jgi:ferredoxin-NADP reductase
MISTERIARAAQASAHAVRTSAHAVRARGAVVARRLFLDRQVELWAAALDGAWSLSEIRARVVAVVAETSDTRTFVLSPNARWRGHRAGQYVSLEIEIDGVRVRRCYSISSAPGEQQLAITVKRTPGGRVSNWLHDHLRVGDVVRMGPAAGDFVLPATSDPRGLFFVSGGSGITPVMSMLRSLAARGPIEDLVFVHHARSRADVIFGAELARLAAAHRGLRLIIRTDDEPGGRFDERRLIELVPDFAARATFLCGPPPLMERVERMYEAAGATVHLKRERFGLLPSPAAVPASPLGGVDGRGNEAFGIDALGVEVRLARSGRRFTANRATPLLDQLERAGERPPYGCRMGICQTCQCTKRSGTVLNSITGAVSSEPNEKIQLCISVPRSDVELEEETS